MGRIVEGVGIQGAWGREYTFFFSFEISKDNITALTYQHRNDQSIAHPEYRRRRNQTTKQTFSSVRRFSIVRYTFHTSSTRHENETKRQKTDRSSMNSLGARCRGRSTFHFCYRTIYNISLINRLNSISK